MTLFLKTIDVLPLTTSKQVSTQGVRAWWRVCLNWGGKGYAPFIHAATPIGRYNIDNFGIWLLRFNGKEIPLSTGSSLEEAKQAANEHYKRQIKQALGL